MFCRSHCTVLHTRSIAYKPIGKTVHETKQSKLRGKSALADRQVFAQTLRQVRLTAKLLLVSKRALLLLCTPYLQIIMMAQVFAQLLLVQRGIVLMQKRCDCLW